ncbi:MAG: hypothetical protein QW727_01285 [Candidatus Pacearchaeota archaeon]
MEDKIPNTFQWIVIVVIIIIIFIFVKLKYIKHKVSWIVILLLILLFYIGFIASIAGQDIDLGTFEGSQTAIKLYLSWLGNNFNNLKILTGQATKLDWGTNKTAIKEQIIPKKS